MKYNKIRRLILVFITIGFFTASLFPIISGNTLLAQKNKNLLVNFDEAKKIVNKKISQSEFSNYNIKESAEIKDDNKPIMYLFLLNPQGYFVVPANKNLPPIIAYSFENRFGLLNQENVLFNLLKEDIKNRLSNIDQISKDILKDRYVQWQKYLSSENIKTNIGLNSIGPLLDTKWSQKSPFNDFCPIDLDSGKRSVAGCPAVAMAQILNYHRTTQNIQFDDEDDYFHNYAGNRYTIDDDFEEYDFPSFPELNNYLITLEDHYLNEIPLTDDDKAAITFSCGIAAKQVYHPSGSGTWGVNQAFDAYKRFHFDDIELLQEGPDVYTRLQSNILDSLPVHIAVVDDLSNPTKGHNMVVDGYNDEGYYHINFGWSGSYDGWYMLPEELPFELTVLEGIIVDINPISDNSGLEGEGFLNWENIAAGSTNKGSFIIWNGGNPGSSLDWEILSWPEWGTWTFEPDSGVDLTPEDGELTIDVTVTAPDEKDKKYAGYIKIVNKNNISDYCLIHISLTTPKTFGMNYKTQQFFENFPYLYWLFQNFKIFRLR